MFWFKILLKSHNFVVFLEIWWCPKNALFGTSKLRRCEVSPNQWFRASSFVVQKLNFFATFVCFPKISWFCKGVCVYLCWNLFFEKKEVPLPGFTLFVFCKTWWKNFHIVSARVDALWHVFLRIFEKTTFLETPLLSCGFVLKTPKRKRELSPVNDVFDYILLNFWRKNGKSL